MNEYIGKSCPFCKSPFAEDDEIVVCSECDIPHHKECWVQNQGCTTFGCMGTIKGIDGSSTTVTATEISFEDNSEEKVQGRSFCPKCGSPRAADDLFCANCGNNFSSGQQSYNAQQGYNAQQSYGAMTGDISDGELHRFIVNESPRYIYKFKELKSRGESYSWNWAAFFFSAFWLFYRRLYAYGIAAIAAALFISLIPPLSVFSILLNIATGIFGDYLYLDEVEKNIRAARQMDEPDRSYFISRKAGVDVSTVMIVVGVAFFFVALSSL